MAQRKNSLVTSLFTHLDTSKVNCLSTEDCFTLIASASLSTLSKNRHPCCLLFSDRQYKVEQSKSDSIEITA
jgi:hypothetical protein